MFDRKRSKTAAVSLTVAKGTLVSLIGALKSSVHGHQFKKIKHQTVQGRAKQESVIRLAQFWAAQPHVDRCVAQRPLDVEGELSQGEG
jgi:hypothetical protein